MLAVPRRIVNEEADFHKNTAFGKARGVAKRARALKRNLHWNFDGSQGARKGRQESRHKVPAKRPFIPAHPHLPLYSAQSCPRAVNGAVPENRVSPASVVTAAIGLGSVATIAISLGTRVAGVRRDPVGMIA